MAAEDEITAFRPRPPRAAGGLVPGTLLNGIYRIDERLGAGGMGEVYRATNIANGECDAIKIIGRDALDQPRIEAMFRKEARVLARIRSPAVAQLKLFARDGRLGLLYFVTDFVPGPSLLDRLKQRPAVDDELERLLRRVLIGLAAVHEAGAVHRDLSPDNIVLPDGDVGRATIIDFGIVKETDPSRSTIIGGGFAGKLGYIAPEQLGFGGAEVGPWSDLYSLALVGAAFAGGRPLDMGATMGMAEEARRRPVDLSRMPDRLRPIFLALLTYDWRSRPQSAGEVLAMLDRAAAPPTVSPSPPPSAWPAPPPPPPPAWPPPPVDAPPPEQPAWEGDQRRRGIGWLIAGIAALGVLALLVLGYREWRRVDGSPTTTTNATDAVENVAEPTPTAAETPATPAPLITAAPTPTATPTPRAVATPTVRPTRVMATPSVRPTRSPVVAKATTPLPLPVAPPPPPRPVSQAAPARLLPGMYFNGNDYPASALRTEAQGTTWVLVSVGVNGRVTDCAVQSSSGNAALDGAACRVARARMRFAPGRDDAGNPVASTFRYKIAWVLPTE